jgi:uncharacterized protein
MSQGSLPVDSSATLLATLASVTSSDTFYVLECNDAKVLFRIDGLVLKISDVAHEMLRPGNLLRPEERVSRAREKYSEEAVCECLLQLEELANTQVLAAPLIPAAPAPPVVQPSGILLMVTQTCNLACAYCYASGGSYGSETKFMSTQIAQAAIDLLLYRAPSRNRVAVTFFGGEPLLNFSLIKSVVSYCEARSATTGKHFNYSMTTNGTILTEDMLSFLRDKKFGLMVSFDGMVYQDRHRRFANGRGSQAVVTRNLERLRAAGVPVQMRATVVRDTANRKSIEDLVQIGKKYGCARVVTSPVDLSKLAEGETVRTALDLTERDTSALHAAYRDATANNLEAARGDCSERLIFDPHSPMMKALAQGSAVGLGRCGACYAMAAVSTEGKIYPCHRFVGMDGYAIGDVEGGVQEERVDEFFRRSAAAYEEKCSACWARLICGGICYYRTASGDGYFQAPEELDCESYRASLRSAIGFLLELRSMTKEQVNRYVTNLSQ